MHCVVPYIYRLTWHYSLLGLAICPAILQLILLPVCPESPRYLLIQKQWEEEARKGMMCFNLNVFD